MFGVWEVGYAVSGGAVHGRLALDVDETETHFVDVYAGDVFDDFF
jgi:hypothetical protein